jgi:transcriptional regulator with XRE-family HTH domain
MPPSSKPNRKTLRLRKTPSRANPLPSAEIRIGIRVKHARLTKGLSLRQLANEVNCSESFISKIENDKVRPSFSMLHRMVAALEMNVAALFTERPPEAKQVDIMRPGQRPVIRVDPVWQGKGIQLERLKSNSKVALLQANIHHVEPGANTDGAISHDGEEFGYVLTGKLLLMVDNISYLIKEGESFSFNSKLPHSYSNPGNKAAKVLWLNTPPTF